MTNQSSIPEATQVGLSVASHLTTINAIIKGIYGGPLGAALGASLQNRHTIYNTVITIIVLLLLPVMFIIMLPGLVFGSLSDNSGALNDNTLISENIRAANLAIVEVLMKSHDDVLSEITAAISHLPEGEEATITDPYAYTIAVNVNLLISQFCASKDNFEEINIEELKKIILENKDGLFTYTVSTETVTIDAQDNKHEEPETSSFIQHNYIINYAGDSYFADHVFHLTDKQKEIAFAYAENLSLFFGSTSGIAYANVSDAVLVYRATVERIAARFGMSNYVELILAVMMQESGGKGLDVMQSAEGAFNTRYPHKPNGILDPEYSIECGIQELKYALEKAGCTGPTDLEHIKLALQGYNFGSAYIDWAIERDGGYTKENAIAYSDMMCARPSWQYDRYGDKEYVEHVLRYYIIISESQSIPAGEAARIDLSQRMNWLFPNGTPVSQSAVEQYLVTIQVPINNSSGEKTTASLTVHHALASEISAIFEEIQATGFKIHELSCYGYRKMASGTGSLSHHSYGVAIDINWSENPAVYWGYSPDPNSEYYINQNIVNIFKAHGFYWGGDWSANFYDPMHFSYTNH